MKVEQLFECHQVGDERKVSLATLSFQGNAMYWLTSLERRLSNSLQVQYWNDLRSAMRRKQYPSTIIESLWTNFKGSNKKP